MLSSEAIKEFKELYFRKTGKELNSQEVLDLGIKTLVIMGAIYKTIPCKEESEIPIQNLEQKRK